MLDNYTVLHLHTDLSTAVTNIDSITKPIDYIKMAKSLGMKALAFTEHGNILNWYKKKQLCEENGLKYIHGVECYLTETLEEKIRDNYHCCLYAKNYEGFKELNKLISKSFNRDDNHFYYVPRISFDELEETSDNILITSACCGGVFGKASDDIKNRFLNFFLKNKDRCYLEIQHHLDDKQKELNRKLYKLARKYKLKLITGTDTHALNETHAKGRAILQKSKNIFFGDEDNWDITFKTYEELIELYNEQDVIPMLDIFQAIDNTNEFADRIEEFKIDTSYKYPKLWKNPKDVLIEKIKKGIKEKKLNELPNFQTEYIPRIKEELETYEHNKAIDFLLLDEDIKSYARDNGVFAGYGRGSVSGSLIAYIIGMTDMDSIKHKLNFQRFMNTERVSLADVDTDWNPQDRDFVKDYIYNKEGLYCADIIIFNTIALKGSIRDVCKALYNDGTNSYLELSNKICENVDIKEDYYRNKYKELFEYVDIINGTIVSVGTHACGVIVSDSPLDDSVGLMSLGTTNRPVSMLNMKEIDSQNFVKLDILGLDNITLINETCRLANIERLTPNNVKDDIDVWKSIRDNTLGIFQWEGTGESYIKDLFSDKTIENIKKYNPDFKYMDLLSVGNAAIRPAGASYRYNLAKGIFKDNGHQALNDLLSPTLGYLVYQEQLLEFLHKFCGYTMGQADIVRRGFSKKIGTEQFIPQIKEGFIKTMRDSYGVEKEESEIIIGDFLQVISDASDYLFSLNHSEAYSYIGYVCGYLRYYYPLEFLTTAFNIYKDKAEKTKSILEYANSRGIKLRDAKFRYSKAEYFFDRETNIIYKGLASIKYMNEKSSNYLFSLKDNVYDTFVDLLLDLKQVLDSRQIDLLIKIGFFSEFGSEVKLLKVFELFNTMGGRSTLSKIKNIEFYIKYKDIITPHITKESEKQIRANMINVVRDIELVMEEEKSDIRDILKSQKEFIGSISVSEVENRVYEVGSVRFKENDCRACVVEEIRSWGREKLVSLYCLKSQSRKKFFISKDMYESNPFGECEIIYLKKQKVSDKGKTYIGEYDVKLNY